MQQQLVDLQERVRKLEQHTERMQRNITDVDILTQHVHDAVYNQQQREAARQTVAGLRTSQMKSATR
jgi:DNA-binding protein H-NS